MDGPSQAELRHQRLLAEQYAVEIAVFADALSRYIDLIDSCGPMTPRALLLALDVMLPELYAASRKLPTLDAWFDYEDGDDAASASEAEFVNELPDIEPPDDVEAIDRYFRLGRKLGMADSYSEVFDPYRKLSSSAEWSRTEEPTTASLADDLSRLYDLGAWLPLFRAGSTAAVAAAAWQWRFGFDDSFLGEAITGAMRAVWSLLYVHEDLWHDHEDYWQPLPE